jgi:hypothetical protein
VVERKSSLLHIDIRTEKIFTVLNKETNTSRVVIHLQLNPAVKLTPPVASSGWIQALELEQPTPVLPKDLFILKFIDHG